MKEKEREDRQDDESRLPLRHVVPADSSRRHVRKTNDEHANTNTNTSKGLDIHLFEGQVPADTICAFCRRVFVQPEVSSCQHVFCAHCLRGSIGSDCPLCGERLQKSSQEPPKHLCVKLLNLTLHCDSKCGQVMLLGQLPQHIKEDCPNTPVSCVNAKKGCRLKVKRCLLGDHSEECDFRPVQCEACGGQTTFRDLVSHQKRSQCVQNRIKNQLLQAVRFTRREEKIHKKSLEKQRIRMDMHQRRTEVELSKRLTTARVQRQMEQNYPLHKSHTQLGLRSSSPSKTDNPADINVSLSTGTSRFAKTLSAGPGTSSPRRRSKDVLHASNQNDVTTGNSTSAVDGNGNVFVTNVVESEDGNATLNGCKEYARENTRIQTCLNCHKPFKSRRNKPNSCRWHSGPIVDVFGGTCYTCGRLDYQVGCMTGFHET